MVELVSNPEHALLTAWWGKMWSQPEEVHQAFGVTFPNDLTEFSMLLRKYRCPLWVAVHRHEVLAAFFLHNLFYDSFDEVGGWIAGHIIMEHRQRWSAELAGVLRTHLGHLDIRCYAAVNVHNRASQHFTVQGLHFHRVGVYEDFTFTQKVGCASVIYTRQGGDEVTAWHAAHLRALKHRRGERSVP